jgi:hypothetical protein
LFQSYEKEAESTQSAPDSTVGRTTVLKKVIILFALESIGIAKTLKGSEFPFRRTVNGPMSLILLSAC